jgi:hypothetical protein
MKLRFICAVATAEVLGIWANAQAGVQVTTCDSDGIPAIYYFFACTPNVEADELQIQLLPSEVIEGTQIVDAETPNATGFSSLVPNTTTAIFGFQGIGPFACVPDLPGDQNKFRIFLNTSDGLTLVTETWKHQGMVVASFVSVIACPPGPVSVEESSWGRMKSLYR